MTAITIATECLPRLLMAAGQPQATHHALTAELGAVLHVDGGSGGPPIAIGGGASRGFVVRPRPVTTLTLVAAPWYAMGLALIRSGAMLWKARNPWGLLMIVIGVRDFLDEFAEEGRRRAAAVATAGAAAGAAAARVRARSSLMIRPRPVTMLTLVEKPWYAVGLALIRSGALLWKTARTPWGLLTIVIGVRDFLDEFAEEGRRRAAAVATAGAAAAAASARVRARSSLMIRPRPVTTLTLVEKPWYAVGLALIRSGALLWKTARNPWGLLMIVIGVRDFLDEFAEESRRRATAVATARAATAAASAPVERPSLLMEPPRASPPRSPSSARTAPAQPTMGALGGGAAGGLASTPNDALSPVTGGNKTGERTIRSPPVLTAVNRRELLDAPRDPQAELGLFLLAPLGQSFAHTRCSASPSRRYLVLAEVELGAVGVETVRERAVGLLVEQPFLALAHVRRMRETRLWRVIGQAECERPRVRTRRRRERPTAVGRPTVGHVRGGRSGSPIMAAMEQFVTTNCTANASRGWRLAALGRLLRLPAAPAHLWPIVRARDVVSEALVDRVRDMAVRPLPAARPFAPPSSVTIAIPIDAIPAAQALSQPPERAQRPARGSPCRVDLVIPVKSAHAERAALRVVPS